MLMGIVIHPEQPCAATYKGMPLTVDENKISIPNIMPGYRRRPNQGMPEPACWYGVMEVQSKRDVLEQRSKELMLPLLRNKPSWRIRFRKCGKIHHILHLVDFYSKYRKKQFELLSKCREANSSKVEIIWVHCFDMDEQNKNNLVMTLS